MATGDAAPNRINRLCSADLPPVSAFFNAASGNGYPGRLFMDGEEGGTGGRPLGHVVSSGDSYELTPWLGNMSFENVVAHPNTGSDATVAMALDDGGVTVGQEVYQYRGTKTGTGNPVQRAGLTNGKLYGVKVLGVPQSEFQKTDWKVGDATIRGLLQWMKSRLSLRPIACFHAIPPAGPSSHILPYHA